MGAVPPAFAARLAPPAAALLCVLAVTACGRTAGSATSTTVSATSTSTTEAKGTPTTATASTTIPLPPTPQPSASDAASQLVTAWRSSNRTAARRVATATAVAELFVTPYPGDGLAISRGCSVAFPPLVCTYGPPGGGNANDALYELYVSHAARGWYVSSVMIFR